MTCSTEEREVLRKFSGTLMEVAQLPTARANRHTETLSLLLRNWLSGELGLSEFDDLIYMNVGRYLSSAAPAPAFDRPRPAERPRVPGRHRLGRR